MIMANAAGHVFFADADWSDNLLSHRVTSEETAHSCLERKRARLEQWDKMVADTLGVAATAREGGGYQAGPYLELDYSLRSAEEWEAAEAVRMQGGASLSEPLSHSSHSGLLGRAKDAAGLLEWKQQVLFRGFRVRMSVATGYVDSVRLHSVTKRAEYAGDVLKKVQAVAEAPHGGQVGAP
jgi:hypothetical protein